MGIGIEDIEQECLECGRACCNRRSLGNHVARSHKDIGDLRSYTLKHFLNGSPPKCVCGCGGDVLWHKLLYRFNDYVNGHNETGFCKKGYAQTLEQTERRIERIRETYSGPQADEINARIAASVHEAFKDPVKHQNLINGQTKGWENEEHHTNCSKSQKIAWSGIAGDVRRAKVFTPEFSVKISEANMRRDCKRTSTSEQLTCDVLQRIFPDLVRGKWFNFSERTWCADAWLSSRSAIIEFDGLYWHGLDRRANFHLDQITSMTNDLLKNRLAIDKHLTLLRIKEGDDLSMIHTFDDLIERSYHVVIAGNVIKEGSFKVDDDVPIISRDALLCADKTWVEGRLLPALCDFLRAYVAYHGWFYPPMLDAAMPPLPGTKWLKAFVRSYWDVDPGPAKAFNDDHILATVLRYRLGLNDSKAYSYVLNTGEVVEANETFDISLKNVRRGFTVQRHTVSWFKPEVASQVYKRFLVNVTHPIVWDPSIGFSARLLGFANIVNDGTYYGTDPSQIMIDDASRLAMLLKQRFPKLNVVLNCQGSEKFDLCSEMFDLVFTSPPYFNVEKYVDQPGQCWRDHPTLESWLNKYLTPTLRNAYVGLKPGKYCVINIASSLVDVVIERALSVGFERCSELDTSISLKPDHFSRKKGVTSQRMEPFVVFVKNA